MPDIQSPVPTELPSTRKLIRSTILAAVIASVLLVTVVFPAEYGIDPTGVGRRLGLTQMGEIKASLAKEASRDPAPAPHTTPALVATATETTLSAGEEPVPAATPAAAAPKLSHETRLTLRPGEGKEIKLVMREGARVKFAWSTDRGALNFDQHADSVDPPRKYHGYAKGTAVPSATGELVAAFDGFHGWFWRNRTKADVTLTLRTDGEYTALKEQP